MADGSPAAHLSLEQPEKIEVTVPVPDYPPMLFIYKGFIHKVKKADGPERMEREWWMDKQTQIRDYYRVEDESGARYWLFRSGKYDEGNPYGIYMDFLRDSYEAI
ncbi:hypothetical protein LWM68_08420 [Niabella sp. W65]|nr:hypothetical protein [Niabella sp. W65]MCH7362788.1 hypothetical protein [Niabella sp. W65]ULT38742.1 hypothetical protein KRR40_27095 [Niabella sp. I65]